MYNHVFQQSTHRSISTLQQRFAVAKQQSVVSIHDIGFLLWWLFLFLSLSSIRVLLTLLIIIFITALVFITVEGSISQLLKQREQRESERQFSRKVTYCRCTMHLIIRSLQNIHCTCTCTCTCTRTI